jgi:hypothetical protein
MQLTNPEISDKRTNDWDADERRFVGCDQIKSTLIPLFQRRGKGLMIHRIPVNYRSSLWKREAGRDFWKGRFKPRDCYDFFNFLSNKKAQGIRQRIFLENRLKTRRKEWQR